MKTKSDDTILVAIVIVLSNLRSLKHERARNDIVTMTSSSGTSSRNFLNRLHFRYSSWKLANSSSSGELLHENGRNFSKHASTLDVAMVTNGRQRRLKSNFVLKLKSFNFSDSFKSVPQGGLEILDEVYLGGGGGTMCPPWLG